MKHGVVPGFIALEPLRYADVTASCPQPRHAAPPGRNRAQSARQTGCRQAAGTQRAGTPASGYIGTWIGRWKTRPLRGRDRQPLQGAFPRLSQPPRGHSRSQRWLAGCLSFPPTRGSESIPIADSTKARVHHVVVDRAESVPEPEAQTRLVVGLEFSAPQENLLEVRIALGEVDLVVDEFQ